MTTDNRPKCYRCKFLCFAEYGYSDYTVEGSLVSCLHGAIEETERASDFETEKIKDEYGILEAASIKCGKYSEGDPLELNVDCDQSAAQAARLSGDKNSEDAAFRNF